MPDNPDLAKAVSRAISDPGAVLPRKVLVEEDWDGTPTYEPVTGWQARAVLEAVTPFLAKPAVLDDSDRPHVEEARRLLAAFGEGRNPVPACYSTTQTLVDIGRTLLGALDRIAPKGEPGA